MIVAEVRTAVLIECSAEEVVVKDLAVVRRLLAAISAVQTGAEVEEVWVVY